MKISTFRSADDNRPVAHSTSWSDFVIATKAQGHELVHVPAEALGDKTKERAFKNGCPLFSPCEFKDGGKRSTADALRVHFGVLDLDHLTRPQLLAFLEGAQERGIEVLVYTSWSNSPDNASARACIPLTRPVEAHEWSTFWPRLNHVMGGWGDPQCKNIDRMYFSPACPTARAADAEIVHLPGLVLDVDSTLGASIEPEALAASRSTVKISRAEIMTLQKSLNRTKPDMGSALARVLEGSPWSEHGTHDTVLFKLAGELARAFPTGDAHSIATVFEQSLSTMGGDLKWVADKIARRQGEVLIQQERNAEGDVRDKRLSLQAAGRETVYTEEELEAFAAAAGVPLEDFQKRWIVVKGGSFYFFVDGAYRGPYSKDEAKMEAHIALSPATSAGLQLEEMTIAHGVVPRSAQALAEKYGLVANSIVVDLTAQASSFDAVTRTLYEAPCPRRKLKPKFHRKWDKFLRLGFGLSFEQGELWIAYLPDLTRPLAALLLEGPPGCGKSLIAKAAAHLWTENQPTPLEAVMGSFNSALMQCPLVLADETMPKDNRGRPRTAELREIIQADTRTLRRKYLPDATIKGAIRVVITSNNKHVLDGEEMLTQWDVEAITSRIIHIEMQEAAADYLKSLHLCPGTGVEDELAEHFLWIAENVVKPTSVPRFLVEQERGALHRTMTTGSVMGSACANWMISFLMAPDKLRAAPPGDVAHLVRVYGRCLHVSPRTLQEYWTRYVTNVDPSKATAKRVMDGIRGMSMCTNNTRANLTVPGFTTRQKLYRIRTEDLIEWAEGHGHATREEIEAALLMLDE